MREGGWRKGARRDWAAGSAGAARRVDRHLRARLPARHLRRAAACQERRLGLEERIVRLPVTQARRPRASARRRRATSPSTTRWARATGAAQAAPRPAARRAAGRPRPRARRRPPRAAAARPRARPRPHRRSPRRTGAPRPPRPGSPHPAAVAGAPPRRGSDAGTGRADRAAAGRGARVGAHARRAGGTADGRGAVAGAARRGSRAPRRRRRRPSRRPPRQQAAGPCRRTRRATADEADALVAAAPRARATTRRSCASCATATTWYRVRVGRFASAEQATEVMQRLREHEGVSHVFVATRMTARPPRRRTRGAGAAVAAARRLPRARAQGNLIPVCREILADLETPVSAFLKIHRGAVRLPPRERRGRREVGALQLSRDRAGARVPRARARRSTLETPGRRARARETRRSARRAEARSSPSTGRWRCPACRASPAAPSATSATTRCAPSSGCRRAPPDDLGLPERAAPRRREPPRLRQRRADDQGRRRTSTCATATTPGAAYDAAVARIDELVARLARAARSSRAPVAAAPGEVRVEPDARRPSRRMVARAKEYIRAGDVIQVVLAQRFELPLAAAPVRRLPLPPHGEPVAVHVLPRARRPRRWSARRPRSWCASRTAR